MSHYCVICGTELVPRVIEGREVEACGNDSFVLWRDPKVSTAVVVDRFEEPGADKIRNLYCTILVERESQKPIVVGKGGAMIKQIGTAARQELERYLDSRVYLDLHVKVKSEWRNDERALDEIGLNRDR